MTPSLIVRHDRRVVLFADFANSMVWQSYRRLERPASRTLALLGAGVAKGSAQFDAAFIRDLSVRVAVQDFDASVQLLAASFPQASGLVNKKSLTLSSSSSSSSSSCVEFFGGFC